MAGERPVVIVGGGLAGLACAVALGEAGRECVVLEKDEVVGGRVRTDIVDGFRLDRGFQVLQTSYPEARRVLDYRALRLKTFEPGALVRHDGRFSKLVDPWRRPLAALRAMMAPIGSLADKVKIGKLRGRAVSGSLEELLSRPSTSTLRHLEDAGLSREIVDCFFRPFYGGVFLERDLETSSRMFEFTFRMFATGDAALPEEGMGAIPLQLATRLRPGVLRTGVAVGRVEPGVATSASGERIEADAIVVAVEGPAAAELLPGRIDPVPTKAVATLHFDAPEAPVSEPFLLLNGEGRGPVNDLCVPSQVAPTYAPPGRALVSASVVGPEQVGREDLENGVREQLTNWFGPGVAKWRTLRVLRIREALPALRPGEDEPIERPVALGDGLFVCGDHRDLPSIQGALASGRRAALAVLGGTRGSVRTGG